MGNKQEKGREGFGSRIGFILVSAGCAIGIGNVWKFPYLCGQYGGAAFILIYLIFLLLLGIPVMVCEFAIGRSGRKSAALSFESLEKPGTNWHHLKWISIVGCYMLMMYYTTVTGWMFNYCYRHIHGEFVGVGDKEVVRAFHGMLGNTTEVFGLTIPNMLNWTMIVCILGFVVCFFGIKNGVERVSKVMMTALIILMMILAVHSVFLKGAGEGMKFYLIPNFSKLAKLGWGNVIYNAMSQAFFTLSIGIGAMLIFGSYIDKKRSLTGEAITITALDTSVALMAGFIIIPACFAYGISPDAGPSLIFITIPNLFSKMPGGRFWGALFFVFLSFAALSTVIAVFENIISFFMDRYDWSRKKSVFFSSIGVILLSVPCVLGYSVWSGFQPLGEGSTVLDLEDFIVSQNLLPLGSLAFVLFCTRENGWGWNQFLEEANTGDGIQFPNFLKRYMTYALPVIITVIYVKGYYDMFKNMGTKTLVSWMIVAVALLVFIFIMSFSKGKEENKIKFEVDKSQGNF